MPDECRPLPIVRIEKEPVIEDDCSRDLVARKMYEQAAPAIVKISRLGGSGSGFFVRDGSQVVTNAHVVAGENDLLEVETFDHKTFDARIEKLDDINDLAVLRLEDGAHGPSALKLGSSKRLASQATLYALGHPLGLNDTFISPGSFQQKGPFSEVSINNKPLHTALEQLIKKAMRADSRAVPDALAYISSPRVMAKLQTEHGSSGGAIVDHQGELIAVDQSGSDKKGLRQFTFAVPAEKVNELLNTKNDKFRFEYEKQSFAVRHPLVTGLSTALILGGIKALPRTAGALLATNAATNLHDRLEETPPQSNGLSDKAYRALQWTADLSYLTGGVLTIIPKTKSIGVLGLGIGLAATLGKNFIPHRLGLAKITRSDGDQRPPFLGIN